MCEPRDHSGVTGADLSGHWILCGSGARENLMSSASELCNNFLTRYKEEICDAFYFCEREQIHFEFCNRLIRSIYSNNFTRMSKILHLHSDCGVFNAIFHLDQ